jgi:hypothetical protein
MAEMTVKSQTFKKCQQIPCAAVPCILSWLAPRECPVVGVDARNVSLAVEKFVPGSPLWEWSHSRPFLQFPSWVSRRHVLLGTVCMHEFPRWENGILTRWNLHGNFFFAVPPDILHSLESLDSLLLSRFTIQITKPLTQLKLPGKISVFYAP